MRKKPLANFTVDPLFAFGPPPSNSRPASEKPQSPINVSIQTSQPIQPPYGQNQLQSIQRSIYPESKRYIGRGQGEMNRLADTIDKLASRNKLNYSFSKQNSASSRVHSPISSFNTSHTTLPRIDKGQLEVQDESKLMQEIRRVENRIKQLKFQRNEANQRQNNFQMIRPFLEVQNQNLVNLQMMILAQNKRHHCCSKSYFERKRKHKNIPMQVRQSQESQVDSDAEEYQEVNSEVSTIKSLKKMPKKQQNKNKKKKYNFVKLRKFRVAVIAVYFALLFPKYSNKFTIRRYRLHSTSFFNTEEYNFKSVINSFIEEILSLNTVKIAQFVRASRSDKNQRRVAKTAKLIITEQYEGKRNFEFYIGDVEMFLLQFLKKLQQQLQNGTLQNILKFISKGDLPLSFPIDQFHLLEQIYRITFNQSKLYLKISKEESKSLIIGTFFIKFLIFSYLFLIKDSIDLKKRLLKQNKLKNEQMIEVELAATEMYFSGVVLHKYCMDLIKQQLYNSQGNGNKTDPLNLPIPKPTLIFNHFGEIEKSLGASIQNKVIRKKSINNQNNEQIQAQYGALDIDQYEEEPIFLFNYIKNVEHFRDLMQMIKKSSDYQTEIKDKIMDIVDTIYKKMIDFRKEEYKQIKQDMLFEEKNILKHKISTSQIKMPKRNGEEKQFLKNISKLISQNKVNEENYHSDQEQENDESENDDEDNVEELPPQNKDKQSSVSSSSKSSKKYKKSNTSNSQD